MTDVSPDAMSPDAVSPDAVSPDAVSPDAVSPDAVSPDAVSPDAVSVRRVVVQDAERLRSVRLAALAESPSAFASSYAGEAAQPPEFWRGRATGAPDRVDLFAVVGAAQEVVGLCGCWVSASEPRVAEVVSMWVDPVARGRGVARSLVEAAVAWADAAGADHVELWVSRGNGDAIAAYTTLGFEGIGVEHLDVAATDASPCRTELRMRLRR
jgi:ribosomal protein S18 acetylase RimI-like enzyme